MKKILSILLVSILALASVLNAGAGNVNFRFNIKDANGNAVSGVSVAVSAGFYNASGTYLGEKSVVTIGPSGDDGVASGSKSFTNTGGNYASNWGVGDGWIIYGPSFTSFQSVWRLSAIGPTGYSFKTRDFKSSSTRATISGSEGNDERFTLTGSWLNDGATIIYDITVNTPTPRVSFDTSIISNASDFPSIEVPEGTTFYASSITATPVCTDPNYGEFLYWSLDGTTEFVSQIITSSITLKPVWRQTHATVSFKKTDMRNPGSFDNFTVELNTSIAASGHVIATPQYKNDDMEFNYWSLDGSTQYDLSTPVTDNITLIPVWKLAQQDPDAKGIINFVVRIFDHDSYWRNPHFRLNSPITVNGVTCNYAAADYKSNDGWTTIAVDGLKFKLMSNPDMPGSRPEPILPVGYSRASDWDETVSRVTTSNGTAQYVLDAAMLAKLNTGWVIDTDPDPDCLGTITRIGTQIEWCTFNWDLEVEAVPGPSGTTQQAGLLGSRYVKEGERHDNNGKIHISNNNENDVVKITTDMKRHGFEMTFYCYVVAAPTVQFDINGGTNPGFAADKYPIQKFKPVKSVGEDPRPNYKAVNPGNPIPPSNLIFTGWHEVIYNDSGEEYLDPSPFDFNKQLTKSVFVRATYTDALYEVRWAPETWTGESDNVPPLYEKSTTYENGSKAMYHAALPTKTGGNYTFDGWDLYEKDASGEKDFGALGKYKKTAFIPQGSMIEIQSTSGTYYQSPNAINGKNQIYVAHFLAGDTKLTISKSGLKSGDTALFTISDGATTMKLVLTGTGSTVNQTIILPNGGTWTVTEDMSWAWSYENTEYSKTIEIAEGEEKSLSFTNTEKTGTVKHAEATVKNVFTKTK